MPHKQDCPACGAGEAVILRSAIGDRAYCPSCFHGWRTDPPVYVYSNTAMCSLGTSTTRLSEQIRFFAPFLPPNASVLEIGCATGELAAATRAGISVGRYDAIELSPAGEQARGLVDRLYAAPLRELLDRGEIVEHYDLILMSHVLEHLNDPGPELRAMNSVLKAGGHIFLEVPNLSGHRRLPIDDNRSHLHFFSASSLTRMLAREGLETIATATDVRLDARYADSLQVVARPFAVPAWTGTILSDHPAIVGENAVVVWGAGSLAEEVLANFFDPARIDYFIDRNPEKHGSTCLGRPVNGPDALGREPRTILINSIDFADAIARDIVRLAPNTAHRLIRIGDLFDLLIGKSHAYPV